MPTDDEETPDELVIRQMRVALADFFCDSEFIKGVGIEQRVEAMLQFAASGVASMPGNRAENLLWGVEGFVGTLRFLMPDVGVEFSGSKPTARKRTPEEVH